MDKNEPPQDISALLVRNLKFRRTQLGLSQANLAEKAQVSTTFLAEIETGKKLPSLPTLGAIAKALDLQIYELLLPSRINETFASQLDQERLRAYLSEVLSEGLTEYLANPATPKKV